MVTQSLSSRPLRYGQNAVFAFYVTRLLVTGSGQALAGERKDPDSPAVRGGMWLQSPERLQGDL